MSNWKQTVGSVASGAGGILSAVNPLLGGAVSLGGNILSGWGAKNAQEDLDAELEASQQGKLDMQKANAAYQSMLNANLAGSNMPNGPVFQYGGQFQELTGDLGKFIGSDHEQGGTPFMGAEMEKNETFTPDGYVFSNDLKPKGSKQSFSQESEKIKKKFKGQLHNKVEKAEYSEQLKSLALEQEAIKAEMEQKVNPQNPLNAQQAMPMQESAAKFQWGGPFNPLNDPTLTNMSFLKDHTDLFEVAYNPNKKSNEYNDGSLDNFNMFGLSNPNTEYNPQPSKGIVENFLTNYTKSAKNKMPITNATNSNIGNPTNNAQSLQTNNYPTNQQLNYFNMAGLPDPTMGAPVKTPYNTDKKQTKLGLNLNLNNNSPELIQDMHKYATNFTTPMQTPVEEEVVVDPSAVARKKKMDNMFGANLGNIYNIFRGTQDVRPETRARINFEDFQNENMKVDLDLVDYEREIAEGLKSFQENQYNTAQNSRGAGNYLTNSIVNASKSGELVSDIVHRTNAANVAIKNQESMFNAQQSVRDSDNILKSMMYNAEQQDEETIANAQNRGIQQNMLNQGIQGISAFFNQALQDQAITEGNEAMLLNMPTNDMTDDQKANWISQMKFFMSLGGNK